MLDTFDEQRLMDYESHVEEQCDGSDREDPDLDREVLKNEAERSQDDLNPKGHDNRGQETRLPSAVPPPPVVPVQPEGGRDQGRGAGIDEGQQKARAREPHPPFKGRPRADEWPRDSRPVRGQRACQREPEGRGGAKRQAVERLSKTAAE